MDRWRPRDFDRWSRYVSDFRNLTARLASPVLSPSRVPTALCSGETAAGPSDNHRLAGSSVTVLGPPRPRAAHAEDLDTAAGADKSSRSEPSCAEPSRVGPSLADWSWRGSKRRVGRQLARCGCLAAAAGWLSLSSLPSPAARNGNGPTRPLGRGGRGGGGATGKSHLSGQHMVQESCVGSELLSLGRRCRCSERCVAAGMRQPAGCDTVTQFLTGGARSHAAPRRPRPRRGWLTSGDKLRPTRSVISLDHDAVGRRAAVRSPEAADFTQTGETPV